MCACAIRPSCESNRLCQDETGTIAQKDPRTGWPRAAAEWAIIWPPHSRIRQGQYPLARFYCAGCWSDIKSAAEKPLVGIDRPPHASEDWRPSIIAHIELTRIENARQARALAPPQYDLSDYDERRMTRLGYTPAQREQARFVRRKLHEFRESA